MERPLSAMGLGAVKRPLATSSKLAHKRMQGVVQGCR